MIFWTVSHLQKELAATQEARELEISELNKLLEECKLDKQQELDKKVNKTGFHRRFFHRKIDRYMPTLYAHTYTHKHTET